MVALQPHWEAQEPEAPRRAARTAGSERSERAPLGTPTEKQSALVTQRLSERRERREGRYGLRDVLSDVSRLPRLSRCGRWRVVAGQEPEVRRREGPEGWVAHFARLQLCGLIWVCPVCGPYLRQKRADELNRGCACWLDQHGVGSVMLLTLTVPHDQSDTLARTLDTVRQAFKALVGGRRWQDDKARFGLQGSVRAHDCTLGPNGWHPHLHIVLMAERVLNADDLAELETRLYDRWAGAVVKNGLRRPTRANGIRLEQARSLGDVARYVCQVVTGREDETPRGLGFELARGDLKTGRRDGHRTPWEVLAAFAETGDEAELVRWHEWEEATRGVQAIRWSNGLKALTGVLEQTDDELRAIEIGGEVVYLFRRDEWKLLCKTRGARARVLDLAEDGGTVAVVRYIRYIQALAAERADGRRALA